MQLSDFIVEPINQYSQYNRNFKQSIRQHTQQNRIRNIRAQGNVPFYDDYLCDKEVESYFDNPVYFDCYKQPQKIQQETNYKQSSSSTNSNGLFLVNNQNKFVNKTNKFSIMISNNKKLTSTSLFKTQINSKNNLIGSGLVRQSNGESYC